MRNPNHIHHNHNNPHMHTRIREPPANHPRSNPLINPMQGDAAIVDGTQNPIIPQSKDRCSSAESSTCSHAELNALLEPKTAVIKPRIHSSAFILDNHPLTPKAKRSGTWCDATIDDTRRSLNLVGSNYHGCGHDCNRNHQRSSSNELIRANDAIKFSAGVVADDHAGECAGTKVLCHVCCMCGDSGITELMFVCSKCSHRHQHIYCSRSYPKMGDEASICNWCLHEEESVISTVTKPTIDAVAANKAVRTTVTSTADITEHQNVPLVAHVVEKKPCERQDHVLDDEDVLVNKGHSKAFEYLLLVAAQSLPQDNTAISGANAEIKQESHIKGTTNLNRSSFAVVGKANSKGPEISKTAVTPLVNIVNVGPHVENKANCSPHINKLSMSLGTQQNMIIHSEVKISIDHKNMDHVGRLIGGGIPKRQRCFNKGINAALKCRKKGLQLSPSRPNYRRYKLLADVVC